MLAHENHGNVAGQAADDLIGRIDNQPLFLDLARFGHKCLRSCHCKTPRGVCIAAAPVQRWESSNVQAATLCLKGFYDRLTAKSWRLQFTAAADFRDNRRRLQ